MLTVVRPLDAPRVCTLAELNRRDVYRAKDGSIRFVTHKYSNSVQAVDLRDNEVCVQEASDVVMQLKYLVTYKRTGEFRPVGWLNPGNTFLYHFSPPGEGPAVGLVLRHLPSENSMYFSTLSGTFMSFLLPREQVELVDVEVKTWY